MKKIAPIVALALLAASFTSCKKDYVCKCSIPSGTSQDIPMNDAKKKDAQAACDAANTTWAIGGGKCTLE